MAFRTSKRSAPAAPDPISLFHDLRATRKVEGLLSQQADILRAYTRTAADSENVAIRLPTGSGKTLVGLLLAEWWRRRANFRTLYLCPTKQLVNQVVEQATSKYGMTPLAFSGPSAEFLASAKAAYRGADSVAVSTYSHVFNANPFFSDAQIIIADDAHAAENYVAKMWSLNVTRQSNSDLYDSLIDILKPVLSPSDLGTIKSDNPGVFERLWVEKLPTPRVHEMLAEVTNLLANVQDSKIMFSWNAIREHLTACHFYVSYDAVLIRPLYPPTMQHSAFANARQRIFMSATLGENGDLERLWGVPEIKRLPVPEGWDRQGIGRRLFFFPEARFDDAGTVEDSIVSLLSRAGRSLVMVPSAFEAERATAWATRAGVTVFRATELEESKQPFLETPRACAVLANRYDGIDFPGSECPLLVVSGLPRAINLQERFLVERMGAVGLLDDRILTRIVQAFGRCTRSATDFAAVIVLGEQLNTFLRAPEKRSLFHPELQAEIQFGMDTSARVETEEEFLENYDVFVEHGKPWQAAEEAIVEIRNAGLVQRAPPGTDELRESVNHEIKYSYHMWNGDFEEAFKEARQVAALLEGEGLRPYRGLWYYLSGSAAWLAGKETGMSRADALAREGFAAASNASRTVRWLVMLARTIGIGSKSIMADSDVSLDEMVERIEAALQEFGILHASRFEGELRDIQAGLHGVDAATFVDAHCRLGHLLGFEVGDGAAIKGAPDLWWRSGGVRFAFRDIVAPSPVMISDKEVAEVVGYVQWMKALDGPSYVENQKDRDLACVLVARPERIKGVGSDINSVLVWPVADLQQWMKSAFKVLREVRRDFSGSGDGRWRGSVAGRLKQEGLDATSLLRKLRTNSVSVRPRSS
jgi:hypothetical protein